MFIRQENGTAGYNKISMIQAMRSYFGDNMVGLTWAKSIIENAFDNYSPIPTPNELAQQKIAQENEERRKKDQQEYVQTRIDSMTARIDSSASKQVQQPNLYGKSIGQRGYKWIRNYKAKNNHWVGLYESVMGGSNVRIYDMSAEEWAFNGESRDSYSNYQLQGYAEP